MAAADLVQLIDLSLGSQPCGVVNFNYLHGLLHEIVRRLVQLEGSSEGIHIDLRPSELPTQEGSEAKETPAVHTPEEKEEKEKEKEKERGEEVDRKPSALETPLQLRPSTGALRPYGSQLRPRPSILTAANDLGVLERKMQELETRMNTMESLPELLERKSSDAGATPVSDMWNFTNLNKRLSATEEGLAKTSRLVDELLGEVQGMKSQVASFDSSLGDKFSGVSDSLSSLEKKLRELEALKMAAAKDAMGEEVPGLLTALQSKIDTLQSKIDTQQAEINSMKETVASLDPAAYVTTPQLQEALTSQEEALKRHEDLLGRQGEALGKSERGLKECSEALGVLEGKVEEMNQLAEQVKEMESSLAGKVSVSDLTSLMPQGGGGDEAATLMTKLLELQKQISQIEAEVGKQPALPADLLDKIASMQQAIDSLSAEVASLSQLVSSGGEDRGRLDDLGSQVAQLRERLAEIDRALTALSNAVSSSREGPQAEDEAEGARLVDSDAFEAMQSMLDGLQQEHERLMGTAAHLSHELEVNKDHVKSLYSAVDDLRETKADREQLEVEVRGKADRSALEKKASREWVDSTFERLDREIREARSKLLGQEEAFKMAFSQLNEDVEGKLDRMELKPLKDYFDQKLERVKTAPTVVQKEEAMVDDAAGFRKPLRFRCISCDKPVGIKPLDVIPTLPSIAMFPGTRSFRPYTTYELELIRRHQKVGYPLSITGDYSRSVRSAGGGHTRTRPHQRIRVAPLGSAHTPMDSSYPPSRTSPNVHQEMDIVGQDGHIYKGRSSRKLPPITRPPPGGRGQRNGRHSTSPSQQQQPVVS